MADFGFLRKPDVNDGVQLSYNMLHKPALLGILGAILGMGGYREKGKFPEYYERLIGLLVGIEPLAGFHENGNFSCMQITYTNTVGYANKGENLILHENTLLRPAYRCYLLLDPEANRDHNRLYERILLGESTFIPYLGKNEFQAWWNPAQVREYNWESFEPDSDFRMDSIFRRNSAIRAHKAPKQIDFSTLAVANSFSFAFFERLPIGFRDKPGFIQYEWAEFTYTDWVLKKDISLTNLFLLQRNDSMSNKIIQLF